MTVPRPARAETYAKRAPWLAMVLDHHRQIDGAFAAVEAAASATDRRARLRELRALLTGHSIAEESVIYPALSDSKEQLFKVLAVSNLSRAVALVEDGSR